jgi:hypothetical protein
LPAAGHARGAQQCLAGFGVLNLAFAGRFAGPVFWADFWAGRKASAESAHVQPSLDLKILRFAFGAMGLPGQRVSASRQLAGACRFST